MIQLAHQFGNDARYANSEAARRKKWFIKARQEQTRQDEIADHTEQNIFAVGAVAVIAIDIQIAECKARFDLYGEATVRALEQNQSDIDEIVKRLAEIDLHIQQLLDRAYVMNDGRRVFLTEDRKQAFDEHGSEVSPDELDFDLIGSESPSWESVSGAFNERDSFRQELNRLEAERQEIYDFQEKLDGANARLGEGEITKDELDDLDKELMDGMPLSIRKQIPGFDTADNAPGAKTVFAASTKLEIAETNVAAKPTPTTPPELS